MQNPFEGTVELWSALLSNDAWTIKSAMNVPAIWTFGLVAVLVGGAAIALLYRTVPFVDRYLEPTAMVSSYLAIGLIISVEVVRRFVFHVQAPWSTTAPPFLFLVMTWAGCSYNVRLRSHLAFSELRNASPPAAQFAMLTLDAALWLVIAWVVAVTGFRIATNSAANFQIMLGTDNVMQWWFLISLPLSFVLLAGRVFQNYADDIANYKNGRTLISSVKIGDE